MAFRAPRALTRAAAQALLSDVPKGRAIVIDGLALGVLPEAAATLSKTHPLIALVHHPLALETGLAPDEAAALRESERTGACPSPMRWWRTVRQPRGRLPPTTRVPAERITVAPPGTDRARTVRPNGASTLVALLAVGSIVPRKGYDVLIAALAGLHRSALAPDHRGRRTAIPRPPRRLRADIEHHRLGPRISLLGAVSASRLAELYALSELFVLPSRYEGFGMAYAEAIAHGLPVIGTTAGAIPETVPASAGVLIPPDDVAALAATLRRLIENTDERAEFAAGARAAAEHLPTWRESAKLFSSAIERVV